MPVREAQLLEREAELEELQAALDDARRGTGLLILVEGAAGIGKTRLLKAVRKSAERIGVRVLSARGTELESGFPFALVRQLFEPVVHAASVEEREELLDGLAGLAGAVLGLEPEVAAVADSNADPTFATLNALYWLTSNLAEAQPFLLALDDAHWADVPSLRFIEFLMPRLEELPVLVALAARPSEPGAKTAIALLTTDPAARVIRPRALSGAAVAELVRAELPNDADDEFCAACHEATGGNPFMVRELLVELVAEGISGTAVDAARVREVAPATIQRALLARLVRLPDAASRLARAVAVLGDDADPRQAATLSELDPSEAATAADALAAAGVLETTRPLRFIHPLVRNVVYADLPDARRAALHEAAAELLEHEAAQPERIAIHLLATDPKADAAVVELLSVAARRALERGAPETAIRYVRRALSEPPEPGPRNALLRELTTASLRAGDLDALEDLLGEVVEELRTDPRNLLESADQLSLWLFERGRGNDSVPLLERAVTAARDVGDLALALRFESILAFSVHMPPADARARFERYEGRIVPDTPGERLWLGLRAWAGSFTGESAVEVAELARRAVEGGRLFAEQRDDSLPHAAVCALIRTEQLDPAEQAIEQLVADARARGAALSLAGAMWLRGELGYTRGNVGQAEPDARAAVEAVRQAGTLLSQPLYLGLLIEVLIERDELEAAEAELVAAGTTGAIPETFWFTILLFSRGRLRLAQRRYREALDDLLQGGRDLASGRRRAPFYPWGSTAALALRALGEESEARRCAEQELDRARAWGAPRSLGISLSTLGLIEGGEQGIVKMREAVSMLERSPARLDHARALTDLGAALRRANRRAEAREPLRAALEMARRGGAVALARRAHGQLEASGERLRPLAIGTESLTPSERRIAALAAEGLSNREIAQALFLSVKTVETHLSHAYRKLDIGSRRELAGALDRPQEPA